MDKIEYDISQLDPYRVRVEVFFKVGTLRESLGILYYEKAKKGFINKPVGLNAWTCVDAKVEGLYTKDDAITPSMIVSEGRSRIQEMGL